MFSETIKQELQTRTLKMTTSHMAVTQAKLGKVDTYSVGRYLVSLHYLMSQTVPHLERAKALARQAGQGSLVAYFEKKLEEETGHDKWAADDIRVLTSHAGHTAPGRPVPAAVELARYVASLIETDPRFYVVYVVCAEYFTVLAGPTWIEALTANCGVPGSALTVASKHVEADQAHAEHGFADIDEHLADPALEPAIASTIDRTMQLFDQLFREVVAGEN